MTKKELIKYYATPVCVGNSVYVHFDGRHLVLTTTDTCDETPIHNIALEPEVFANIIFYQKKMYSDLHRVNKEAI